SQATDLPRVREQFPGSRRLVVVPVAGLVRRNVGVEQPQFAALDLRVRFSEVYAPGADRFDLGAGQGDADFQRLEDVILVKRPSVRGVKPLAWPRLCHYTSPNGPTAARSAPSRTATGARASSVCATSGVVGSHEEVPAPTRS